MCRRLFKILFTRRKQTVQQHTAAKQRINKIQQQRANREINLSSQVEKYNKYLTKIPEFPYFTQTKQQETKLLTLFAFATDGQ